MKTAELRARRLRAHRLSAPAPDVAAACAAMLATQAQEFWGGRWALAARSRGAPGLREVDAVFARGQLVRTWTMRGTLHIVPPQDVAWMLSVTAERQERQFLPVHRGIGLAEEHRALAERLARGALRGGGRLTRAEFTDVLAAGGIDPRAMRAAHLISALAIRGVVCWGPVVPRSDAPSREQYLVLTEDWVRGSTEVADPLAELFVRYLDGHGPAGTADFAWWAGLPRGSARQAAERAGERIRRIDDDRYVSARPAPRRTGEEGAVLALPPFEEYYLSYADRTLGCAPAFLATIGPSMNGMVRPILLAGGEVVGVWSHSLAAGRHTAQPAAEVFAPDRVAPDAVATALARYVEFLRG